MDAERLQPALRRLETIREADDVRWQRLVQLVLRACGRAAAWTPGDDPNDARRAADKAFLDAGAAKMVNHLRALLRVAEDHPAAFNEVTWRALGEVGITSGMLEEAGHHFDASNYRAGPFLRKLVAALLDHAEAEQSPESRIIKGKNTTGAQRFVHGPLRYPDVIDTVKMPLDPRIPGLTFELVFYLRRYTAGRQTREIEESEVLPDIGDPCFKVAAEFVRLAVAPEHRDDKGKAFRKAVLSGWSAPVKWWGWRSPIGGSIPDTHYRA